MSPFSKTTLDINKLYVTSPITSKIPAEGEGKTDKAEETTVSKQGKPANLHCGDGGIYVLIDASKEECWAIYLNIEWGFRIVIMTGV